MSLMTNYFESMVLNTMLGVTAQAPSTAYVALFLSNPTETGTAGTEVSYSGYARQELSLGAPVTSGTTVTATNTASVQFEAPPSAAGTVTYAGICDSLTGGNVLVYVALPNSIALTNEMQPKFEAGDIVLTMAAGNMTPSFKTKVLNLLRGYSITGFDPYLALYNGDPTGGGTELSGGGYARLPLVFDTPAEQVSGQLQTMNTNAASTEAATGKWGNWAYGVIMDAQTSGSAVWYKANSAVYNMANGAHANVAAGGIVIGVN